MIKNYEIPAGQYAGRAMLFSIVALAASMDDPVYASPFAAYRISIDD